MTNREALTLLQAFEHAGSVSANARWAYWVAWNKRKLKAATAAFNEIRKPPPEVVEFERERDALARSLAKPGTEHQERPEIRDTHAYAEGLKKLREKFPDVEAVIVRKTVELEGLLDEPLPEVPQLSKIAAADIPDKLAGNVLEPLLDWIDSPSAPAPATTPP